MSNSFFYSKDLTVSFGGLTAVNGLTFEIRKGEILSLIGPNGAGKTTTFNSITGYIKTSAGSIYFCGENITGLRPFQIAARGLVRTFQHTSIFPDVTVSECIMMGANKIAETRLFQILFGSPASQKKEKAIEGLVEQILAFTGLGEKKDVIAKNLAYGEQRLLEIAVAMAAKPKLLICDEPVSGMNPEESRSTMELIRTLRKQGITILLVEHDMSVVMDISDRIVVLNYGKKITEGSPKEVCENEEVIEAYLGGSLKCS
jgi:branched-chain amino acid transport system ATP-binding protein